MSIPILRIKDKNGNWVSITAMRGENGKDGVNGAIGPQGPQGATGPQGPQGPQGEKGADGTMSFNDLTAEQKASLKGDTGATGPKGDTGATGPQGPRGEQGPQGSAGLTPFIGSNGNWWIGTTDTGVKAAVENGLQMVSGGYTGAGNNTVVLSFDFVPKAIFIDGGNAYDSDAEWQYGFVNVANGSGVAFDGYVGTEGNVAQTQKLTCSVSGNTVTITTKGNILSAGGTYVGTYKYVAIG